MADTSKLFKITYPAGSGATNILLTATPLGPCHVRRILMTWPAGCVGLVGAHIKAGGATAFPFADNSYLTFDDYTYVFEVTNQLTTGGWSVEGYNQDYLPHTLQVVYEIDYLGTSAQVNSLQAIAL